MKHLSASSKSWDQRAGYSKKVYLTAADLDRPGQQIQTLRIKPGEHAAAHHHEHQTEIFFFPRTNGEFTVNGQLIELQENDLLIVEPGDIHEVKNRSDDDFVYLCLKLDYQDGDSVNDPT